MGENRDDIIQWACEMALSDSQTALKSLYMTYFGPLMRFTGMYVSSPAEAEEIVSDTFLAIWNNRKQLPGISNFDSYIYTVARHKAISYYRKQHMEQVSLDEISIDLFTSTETTPEEELISQEGIHRLNLAIDSLPAKCKMAFKLVREDKLKYKEVVPSSTSPSKHWKHTWRMPSANCGKHLPTIASEKQHSGMKQKFHA